MISIVIPLYNKERSIVSTIESVSTQTYKDWELIIVDDGSTDNSIAVVREKVSELEKERVRVIHQENAGVCSARNRGIQEAKGEYVALLDADDLWDKDYLKEEVDMIRDFPEAAMWGINFAETDDGKLVRKLATGLPDGYRGYVENYFQIQGRISDLYCSSSVVIKKAVFDKVGMFDERIRYAEDTDLWWRIIATQKVAFYDRYMVFYRFDAENRALKRTIQLRYFLPYYIKKFRDPLYQANHVFYRFVNCWAAQQIRQYFFSDNKDDKQDAIEAVKYLDYKMLPNKYIILYKFPCPLAHMANRMDMWVKGML